MWIFYLIAMLILIVGLVVFSKFNQISLGEWIGSSALAFVIAICFQMAAFHGQVDDDEIWSGQVVLTTHHPKWVSEETWTTTDKDGNSHTHHSYTTHPERWSAKSNIDSEMDVSQAKFNELTKIFGCGTTTERPWKSDFYSGDKNIYVSRNNKNIMIPISEDRVFENRLKCKPTVFSYSKVPPSAPVFAYPLSGNSWFKSSRLLGCAASAIDIRLWDEMNARLGPKKQVNIIMIGFYNQGVSVAIQQEAKYVGGKKNDIVICYGADGKDYKKATWAHVFSWTERKDCIINLRELVLNHKIDNTIMSEIEKEVSQNFVRKDWHKFDYLQVSPSDNAIMWYVIVMIIVQGVYWFWAFSNLVYKNNIFNSYRRY